MQPLLGDSSRPQRLRSLVVADSTLHRTTSELHCSRIISEFKTGLRRSQCEGAGDRKLWITRH
jgi:hypothetical protein